MNLRRLIALIIILIFSISFIFYFYFRPSYFKEQITLKAYHVESACGESGTIFFVEQSMNPKVSFITDSNILIEEENEKLSTYLRKSYSNMKPNQFKLGSFWLTGYLGKSNSFGCDSDLRCFKLTKFERINK